MKLLPSSLRFAIVLLIAMVMCITLVQSSSDEPPKSFSVGPRDQKNQSLSFESPQPTQVGLVDRNSWTIVKSFLFINLGLPIIIILFIIILMAERFSKVASGDSYLGFISLILIVISFILFLKSLELFPITAWNKLTGLSDISIIAIMLLLMYIISKIRNSVYVKTFYIIFILLISFLYLYSNRYPISYADITDSIMMMLIVIFNIYYILYTKTYIQIFKENANKLNIDISLNLYNLFYLLSFVVLIILSLHFFAYDDQILVAGTHNIFNVLDIIVFAYFLTSLLLVTLSVHIWLNLSIVYPIWITLSKVTYIDFLDKGILNFFSLFIYYLARISFFYLLLSIAIFILYWDDAQSVAIEPFLLIPYLLIIIVFSMVTILKINTLAQGFLYAEYIKAYSRIENSSNIDATNNKLMLLEKIIKPLMIKNSLLIFLWQWISLIITLASIALKL